MEDLHMIVTLILTRSTCVLLGRDIGVGDDVHEVRIHKPVRVELGYLFTSTRRRRGRRLEDDVDLLTILCWRQLVPLIRGITHTNQRLYSFGFVNRYRRSDDRWGRIGRRRVLRWKWNIKGRNRRSICCRSKSKSHRRISDEFGRWLNPG